MESRRKPRSSWSRSTTELRPSARPARRPEGGGHSAPSGASGVPRRSRRARGAGTTRRQSAPGREVAEGPARWSTAPAGVASSARSVSRRILSATAWSRSPAATARLAKASSSPRCARPIRSASTSLPPYRRPVGSGRSYGMGAVEPMGTQSSRAQFLSHGISDRPSPIRSIRPARPERSTRIAPECVNSSDVAGSTDKSPSILVVRPCHIGICGPRARAERQPQPSSASRIAPTTMRLDAPIRRAGLAAVAALAQPERPPRRREDDRRLAERRDGRQRRDAERREDQEIGGERDQAAEGRPRERRTARLSSARQRANWPPAITTHAQRKTMQNAQMKPA